MLENIIGQNNVKRILSFQIEAYNASKFMPAILFTGKRGSGKTEIAKGIKPFLTGSDGKQKPFLEINGASLKKVGALVNNAIIPYQNSEVTYFIDEVHAIDRGVQDFILSIINPNEDRSSKAVFDGMELEFDFTKQTFLFATTDPQKLYPAFKNRCKRIDLEPYSEQDMVNMVVKRGERRGITFSEDSSHYVARVCRNTPRDVVKTVEDVRQFCDIKKEDTFYTKDWHRLRKTLNIKPLGLTNTEYNVLSLLSNKGEMSLTNIANSLSLSRSTIMNDVKPFLMEKNLIKIDGKRFITKQGIEVLNEN